MKNSECQVRFCTFLTGAKVHLPLARFQVRFCTSYIYYGGRAFG